MPSLELSRYRLRMMLVVGVAAIACLPACAQDSPTFGAPPQSQEPAPVVREAPEPAAPEQAVSHDTQPLQPVVFDKSIFLKPIPTAELTFLKQYDGAPAHDLAKDKQFRKIVEGSLPDPMFHYGKDMPLKDALSMVMTNSQRPVKVHDGRYVVIPAGNGPYLAGRGMLWVDMQDGLVLGAFYFHPINGEPTPVLIVFSKQIKEDALAMGQLPPQFADDLAEWARTSGVPEMPTRYFIGDNHRRLLLEHDEEYCAPGNSVGAGAVDCQQMDADAADLDMAAAYYLEAVHYATNATAYMAGPQMGDWIRVRTGACGVALACRIRMTREHVRVVMHQPPRRRR